MIRFIDLRKQIGPGEGVDEDYPRQFAFFDTTVDQFVSVDNEQVWDSWADFEYAANAPGTGRPKLIDRVRPLCPAWVFETASSGTPKSF